MLESTLREKMRAFCTWNNRFAAFLCAAYLSSVVGYAFVDGALWLVVCYSTANWALYLAFHYVAFIRAGCGKCASCRSFLDWERALSDTRKDEI